MLDLSSNQLKLIQDGSFNFISTLISLNLANTSLSSLDKDSLSNLVLLKNLNLSENKLDSIPTNQLRNQRKLKFIDLSKNIFKVLSPHAFRQLEALQVFIRKNILNRIVFLFIISLLINQKTLKLNETGIESLPMNV